MTKCPKFLLQTPVLVGVLVYGIICIIQSCGQSSKSGTQPSIGSANANALDSLQVLRLSKDTVNKTVELPAELLPYFETDLHAKVEAFVQSIGVDIGDRVRQNQILAILRAPEVNAQSNQSDAAMESAKAKYLSSKDLYDRLWRASQSNSPGIVAPVDLANSRNQMLADSASVQALRQQAQAYKQISEYLYIKAPFDGVITARKADPGALVNPNTMILSIQNNLTLRLRISVPEIYVAAAALHQTLSFSVDAYPERLFNGVLTRKTETIDPITRTELWEFDVDNRQQLLKAGTFVYPHLKLQRKTPSFIVPSSAIVTNLERRFVIKVAGGKCQWVDIRQGMTTDQGIEIFGNLAPGDSLLIKASDERKPGTTGVFWIHK